MQNKQGGMENNFIMHRRLGEWEVRHHGRCQQPARQRPARPPRGARGKAPPFIPTAKRTHSQVLDTIIGTAQIVGTRTHFARCVLSHVTFTSLSAAIVGSAGAGRADPDRAAHGAAVRQQSCRLPPLPLRGLLHHDPTARLGRAREGRSAGSCVARVEPMNLDG